MTGALLLSFTASAALAACKLQTLATYHVTQEEGRPAIDIAVNGQPAKLAISFGLTNTYLTEVAAKRLGLTLIPSGTYYYGGTKDGQHLNKVRIHDLKIGASAKDVDLHVVPGGSSASDVVGELGQDFLSNFDVELDFAHDAMRLFKSEGCSGDEVVYWGGSYSVAKTNNTFQAQVKLNGTTLYAMLEPSDAHSYVTLEGARRAGVTPSSPGVQDAPDKHSYVPLRLAEFSSFSIGDETVKTLRLRMGDLFTPAQVAVTGTLVKVDPLDWPEMLIGNDFLMAHRIYLAERQGKVYFSYIGGPVFDDPTQGKAP